MQPDADPITEANRPYQPRGAALALMYAREPEVLLSGPAGTGKTRANLEKLFACATKYPEMRGLIVRKTRESLTETGLVTWEAKVVPAGHPCLVGPQRKLRQSYSFPNGSEVAVGGLDKPEKIMSSEFDLIVVLEATELAENDWEASTTRLRNGRMPYQQILGDCNPGPPKHWLKQRQSKGLTRFIESRHEDNPLVWDAKKNEPTERGAAYLAVLDNLTGHRKPRLRYGAWVQAEGVVYEDWDDAVHLIDPFRVTPGWARYWTVDFGFTNPFVWQEWCEDPDGRLYLIREIYHIRKLVEDHARRIRELTKDSPRPRAIICDHDAEDRATLERHLKMPTVAAEKAVTAGIQQVQERLRKQPDGRPRLFICRDALDQRDSELTAAARPTCTAEEWAGYVWDTGAGRKRGEEPVKKDDHGLDCVRYLCRHRAVKAARAEDIVFGGRHLADDAPEGVFGMV